MRKTRVEPTRLDVVRYLELLGGEIGELVDAVAGAGVGRVEGIDAIQVILWMIDHSSTFVHLGWRERERTRVP